MITDDDPQKLSAWLIENFVPSGKARIEAWKDLVRATLAPSVIPGLVDLILAGGDEERYQAVAAARTLGVIVYATDHDATTWDVTLPGQPQQVLTARDARPRD